MTDLITRARKEWCEIRPSPYSTSDTVIRVCPPGVVAALLDVLLLSMEAETCVGCGADEWAEHTARCQVAASFAAITRALEGNP